MYMTCTQNYNLQIYINIIYIFPLLHFKWWKGQMFAGMHGSWNWATVKWWNVDGDKVDSTIEVVV